MFPCSQHSRADLSYCNILCYGPQSLEVAQTFSLLYRRFLIGRWATFYKATTYHTLIIPRSVSLASSKEFGRISEPAAKITWRSTHALTMGVVPQTCPMEPLL